MWKNLLFSVLVSFTVIPMIGCDALNNKPASNPVSSTLTQALPEGTQNLANPIDSLSMPDITKDGPRQSMAAGWDYIQYPINPWYPLNALTFGQYVSGRGTHLGDDCKRAPGTPIYAIYDGYVRYARNKGISSGWGYIMIVESWINNYPFCTVYGHLGSSMYPGEGRWVSKGQYIGTVGSTTESGQTTPHLHLGIHYGVYGSSTGVYAPWCAGYSSSTSGWFNPSSFIAYW